MPPLLGAFSWRRLRGSGTSDKDPEAAEDDQTRTPDEARYRAVVDAATDAIVTMTADSVIESFNAAAETMFGYSQQKAVGMKLTALMPERFREAHRTGLRRYLGGGQPRVVGQGTLELAGLRKDGSEFPIELSVSETWLGDERLFAGIIRDVSERQWYGARVEESEKRFRQLFDQSVDALLVHDEHGQMIDCNAEACRSLGYTREELLSLTVADFATNLVSGEHKREQGESTLWRRSLSGEPGGGAKGLHFGEHQRKDGSTFPVEVRVGGVDYQGRHLILASARDITERRQAERRLETQHAISATLAASDTVSEAAPQVLSELCNGLGWEVGEFWRVEREDGEEVLRCTELWRASGGGSPEYEEFTRGLALPKGTGLSGRAWDSGEPVWIPDITEQWGFLHSGTVVGTGLRAALAFPVLSGEEVLGVMGFFANEPREPDPEVLEMLSAMGSQIGRFVDHKHAEQSLRESEERFRALTEATVEGVVISENGKILETNGAFDRMLRYEHDELVGTSALDLVDEDTINLVRNSIDTDNREIYEGRAIRGDGSPIDVEIHGEISSYQGRSVRVTAVRDITERKAAEQRLRDSEERYRNILQSIEDGYFEVDLDGNLTFFNDALTQIFRYPRAELLGMNNRDHTDEENARRVYLMFNRIYTSGESLRNFEWEVTRGDGKRMSVEVSASLMHDAAGEPAGFRGLMRDISDRKRAEAELAEAYEAAEDANRAKSEFLANMSHEIRTPMNGVIGMNELLLATELSNEQRDYAETARSSGEALLTIINDILDFSKIEAGKLEIETIDFGLAHAVEDSVRSLAGRAEDKGLELASRIEADVPTALRGDPGRLRQVLINLVSNAVKFTEAGEVLVTVSLAEEGEGTTRLRFSVSDTGIGMSQEQQQRLFSAFTQADASTTRRFGGTGLGLAISKQLVELMEGEIWLQSEPGEGSTFSFELPLQRQPEGASPTPRPQAGLAGLHALVVDDNETNRWVLTEQLTSWDMRNEEAADGPNALAKLRAAADRGEPYDVALLDMQMPEMDGIELARQIKAEPDISSTRLLLLTSMGRRQDAEEARHAGIEVYLTKPVRQSELYDALATVISAPPVVQEGGAQFVTRQSIIEGRPRAGGTLLLIEDNAINQKVAATALRKLGYSVEVAANGIEALEALDPARHAAVLMDVQMPQMDGYEATTVIRRRESTDASRTPIIAMTAGAMAGDRERALEAGMDDYITKPFRAEELDAALRRWIPQTSEDTEAAVAVESPSSETAPEPAEATLDPEMLASLRQMREETGEDILSELIEMFLEDTPSQLESLRRALSEADAETLEHTAHALKGTSGTMGAVRMSALSSELQDIGRSGEFAIVPGVLERLEEEFILVREALAAELEGGGA